MRRGLLIFVLALGAIAGFGVGFAHLCGFHRYGHGFRGEGRDEFENHVADVCVRAAERTLKERPQAAEPARPAPPAQ
ncbi:MAG TPA: hypothetical protein VGP93_05410 [Polyangiaceae bacterium]|nr:hypothetical protein [Polyangiaceae bacterium]